MVDDLENNLTVYAVTLSCSEGFHSKRFFAFGEMILAGTDSYA